MAISYYESAEGIEISKARAEQEILAHSCDFEEFLAECGDAESYNAQRVLEWLGY